MKRILIVDDNFANRQLITDILVDYAMCDIALNGQEAVAAYDLSVSSDNPYDMILLDISMPEMSGIDFLKYLRGKEEEKGVKFGKGTPVIMVTAFKKQIFESYNNGCDDFISKPIDPDVLMEKIKNKIGV